LAHKHGIDVLAGVIDRDYLGELKVILLNTGDRPVSLAIGDRIAQGIFEAYQKPGFDAVGTLEGTDRGEGGFGSTGR
jgi:dUTP pyrophosphatase